MAVETTATSASFTGTGVSSTYAPGFYVNSSDQVVVTVDGVVQTLGDDYVVNNVGASTGCGIVGTFTLGSAIYVDRVTPITQLVDTQNNETILEDVLDAEFDKLTMIAQEIGGKADRAILFPRGESGQVLPATADRVNTYLGFDLLGDLIAVPEGGGASLLRTELAAGTGSALIGFTAASVSAVARTAQSKLRETISVKDFGAVGDGVTDDTAAIQAAINAALAAGKGNLYFPDGTYKLTAKLVIPFATGWRFWGQSRSNTILKQFGNDMPIFSFETTLTHSWEITELRFTYNTPQTGAHTNSRAIAFGTNGGTQTFFNCQIRRCMFANCYRSIAGHVGQIPVWAIKISECSFEGSNTGSAIRLTPTPAIGQPKITVENNHLDMGSATESYVAIYNGDNITISNNEFLNGTAPINALEMSQCFATIIGTKHENYNAGAAGTPVMWSLSSGTYTIISCSCNGLLGSGGTPRFIGGSAQVLSIIGLECSSAMSGGNVLAYLAAEMPFVSGVKLYNNFTDDIRAWVGPTQPVPRFNADKRQQDAVTVIGDATVTLTSASDRFQYFGTALTAARNCTLPSTGMAIGAEFEVVRRAGGAGTLTVVDPLFGASTTFPAESRGFVRYRWIGIWFLVNKSIYQQSTGWAADTGAAKKTANATHVASGAAVAPSAGYVQAEATSVANRLQTVEVALQAAMETIKAMKDSALGVGAYAP